MSVDPLSAAGASPVASEATARDASSIADAPRPDRARTAHSDAPTQAAAPEATTTHRDVPRALRGAGFLAIVITFTLCGVADGLVALARTPRGGRHFGLTLWLVFHCGAALASTGLFAGIFQEVFVQAAARRPSLRALVAWLLGGPRRWFAPSPAASLAIATAAIIGLPTIGLLFPVTFYVVNFFHSKILMATAVMLAAPALLAGTSLLAMLAAWPLGWLFRRAGRFTSPGVLLLVLIAGLSAQSYRFARLHWAVYHNLDARPALALAAFLALDLAALALLGIRLVRRGRPPRWRTLGAVAGAALGLFLLSGLTFGLRHAVMSTVLQRSLATRYIVGPLQRAVDLDRDGYGMLFGGGDCNDFNASRHPGARDVPGNGVDENCSGVDARVESEASDGHMVALPEVLRGIDPSVVFLTIDAVRPDHTSVYGYRRNTTPNIASWARNAARFTHAYCTSPRSLRSFASTFTGLYPSGVHWGSDNSFPALEADNTTLAEILHARGYATAAFNNADYFSRTAGFYQGFDEHHEGRTFKDDAELTVRAAIDWLHRRSTSPQPYFAWIHLMEPHDGYRDLSQPAEFGHSEVDRYDEEIARADMYAGRILEVLEQQAARRPLIVAVFSDHGEAFGEHDFIHHSFDLHEEAVRVMLLVRAPGMRPGDRASLTSLMDLYPTVLNLVGASVPRPIPARSLVPVLYEEGTPRRWRERLFTEVTPDGLMPAEKRAVLQWPFKLLYDLQRQSWELYDLSRDPGETNNIFDQDDETASRLRERLLNWMDSTALRSNSTADLIEAHRLPREPQMQNPVHVRFGDVVELLGFDAPRTTYHVGESVEMTMYYKVLSRTIEPVWMAITFERVDGQPFWPHFHISHYPVNGRYPTTQWRPGEILRDEMTRMIEREVAPGRYRVLFSVEHISRTNRYRPSARARPNLELELGTIEILP